MSVVDVPRRDGLDTACALLRERWPTLSDRSERVRFRPQLTRLVKHVLSRGVVSEEDRAQIDLLLLLAKEHLASPPVSDAESDEDPHLELVSRCCDAVRQLADESCRDAVVEATRLKAQVAYQLGAGGYVEMAARAVELSETWFPGSMQHALCLASYASRMSIVDRWEAESAALRAERLLRAIPEADGLKRAEVQKWITYAFNGAKMHESGERSGAAYVESLRELGDTRSSEFVRALILLGEAQARTVGVPAALETYAAARELAQEVSGDRRSVRLVMLNNNVGFLLVHAGRAEEAVPLLEEALSISLETYGRSHPTTTTRFSNISYALVESGEAELALHYANEALDVSRQLDLPGMVIRLGRVCRALTALGRFDEAEAAIGEAIELIETRWPNRPRSNSLNVRAQLWLAQNRFHEAIDDLNIAIDGLDREDSLLYPGMYLRRAEAWSGLGESANAESDALEAASRFRAVFGEHPSIARCEELIAP